MELPAAAQIDKEALLKRIAHLPPEKRKLLYALLEQKGISADQLPIIPYERLDNTAPLSFAQQRLWFLEQLEPDSYAYNLPGTARLRGRLDLAAFEYSLNAIIKRHEALRTTFRLIEGEAVQVIVPTLTIRLPLVDLRHLPASQQAVVSQYITEAEMKRPFDLVSGPLLRGMILWLDQEEYIFLLTMHHIISDSWSVALIFRELALLLQTIRYRQPAPLPTLPVQYADYALWQRNQLQGRALNELLAYWRQKLAGAPARLSLPTDHPWPASPTYNSGQTTRNISPDLTQQLKSLSQQTEVTLFMTLLAAFKALLYRYTHQVDIVIGSPIAGRTHAEIENLIGFFVNTLVLRTDLSENPSFLSLLRQVRETTLQAYAHEELPFEKLVDELEVERNLSHTPLFQVLFTLQNTPMADLKLPDFTLELMTFRQEIALFPLALTLVEKAEGLQAHFAYKTDLFTTNTIDRLADHFVNLLHHLVTAPETPVANIPLLSAGERRQLLQTWNDTATPYPENKCIQHLFEIQAAQSPHAVAVAYGDEYLTYQELNQRANQLAHFLRAQGIGPEKMVGLCLERSLEMVVGIFGILKAGGAYVPLDPTYPSQRLAYILQDSNISFLLTQAKLRANLPEFGGTVVCLDADWKQIGQERIENPYIPLHTDNLAYLIYTSGSTGKPKGVMVSHHNLVCSTHARRAYYREAVTGYLLLSSIAFDSSVVGIFWTLIEGGRLILPPENFQQDISALVALLSKHSVSHLLTVPSLYRLLLGEIQPAQVPDFRCAIVAGDVFPADLAGQHDDLLPHTALFNEYGPTEATVWSSVYVCERPKTVTHVPIGKPIANARLYLLDSYLQPVPVGVTGELHIGGEGVSRGYSKQAPLTAVRFMPDPFTKVPGARLYKTGDLARYLPDGNIEIQGRLDNQIKLHGYRIELGEIEAALNQHPLVRDNVVITHTNHANHKQLAAYIVPNLLGTEVPGEIRDKLVREYQQLYDDLYGQEQSYSDVDPLINQQVWTSSYTNEPLPEVEVIESVEDTVKRILSLKPARVLEIGCGTGLLLTRIAPFCSHYCGTDVSAVAVQRLRQRLGHGSNGLGHVELQQREAADFRDINANSFDMVILNEVVQHFPDVHYLVHVLENAVQVVRAGGFIFLGGLINFTLAEAFHASRQLPHAPATLTIEELGQQVREQMSRHKDLTLDPGFFMALQVHLPQVSHVEVQLKGGNHHNEITKFKYDVILHIEPNRANGKTEPAMPRSVREEWSAGKLSVERLRQRLMETKPEWLAIRNVPNGRLMVEAQLVRLLNEMPSSLTVSALRQQLSAWQHRPSGHGVDPEAMWALSRELPYKVAVCWPASGAIDCFDVLFQRDTGKGAPGHFFPHAISESEFVSRSWSHYSNKSILTVLQQTSLGPELQTFLRKKLPDFMVPANIVLLDKLPLSPNGKIDRQALPDPILDRQTTAEKYVPPRTPVEQTLAEIWSHVLGRTPIGVHDNFFQLGGDSILSIRVVARASQAGIKLTPKQLFENQTVAQLAAVVRTDTTTQAEQGLVTGSVPLTPIQHWFFAQSLSEPDHYNQAILFQTEQHWDQRLLAQAYGHLSQHHDGLRLRYKPTSSGWQQFHSGEVAGSAVTRIDLSSLPPARQLPTLETAVAHIQASLNITTGPLWRIVTFYLAPQTPDRLLITAHHLVIDAVSWGILLEDLWQTYEQLSHNLPVQLPPKTTSFKKWAETLATYAQTDTLPQELAYWLAPGQRHPALIPTDHIVEDKSNTVISTDTIEVSLTAAETHSLLHQAPQAYHSQVHEFLLTGLMQTLSNWTGSKQFLIALEGHGREDVFDGIDVSRTIGWFTSLFPVLFELPHPTDMDLALKAIKEQMRQIPQRGFGYGLLRYLCADENISRALMQLPQPQIAFNYLGHLDSGAPASALFRQAAEDSGPLQSPQNQRPFLLEINAVITNGRLHNYWTYSLNIHDRATIEALARHYLAALRRLITFCTTPGAGSYTPSDFPLASLDQATIDQLAAKEKLLEDIYPLTPSQLGMFFHALYEPDAPIYFAQSSWKISGPFNISAFKHAWELLIVRHPILRTSFVWEGVGESLQIVHQTVPLPWAEHDWRHLPRPTQEAQWAEHLEADKKHSFDFAQAPLHRVMVARLADTVHYFSWSFHHILLDGWCNALILRELFTLYAALCEGKERAELPPARPYKEYVAWLQQQDLTEAKKFWRRTLRGLKKSTPFNFDRQPTSPRRFGERNIHLPANASNALQAYTRNHKLTLNTLVQGVWAMLLHHYSKQNDIVFGCTVSGRPAELNGVESIIGPFITVLPLRVNVPANGTWLDWLYELQRQQVNMRQYEHCSLAQIQKWSEIPPQTPLFESMVVFENYAMLDDPGTDHPGDFRLEGTGAFIRNHFPFTLRVTPTTELTVYILFEIGRFETRIIDQILAQFKAILEYIVDQENPSLSQIRQVIIDAKNQFAREASQKSKTNSHQKLKRVRRQKYTKPEKSKENRP